MPKAVNFKWNALLILAIVFGFVRFCYLLFEFGVVMGRLIDGRYRTTLFPEFLVSVIAFSCLAK